MTSSSTSTRGLRVMAVTNQYPTAQHPTMGVYVEQQIKGLRGIGLDIEVFLIDRASRGMGAYWGLKRTIVEQVEKVKPDVVHVMYGGIVADVTTAALTQTPVVVSFCGSDLLGSSLSGVVARLTAGYGVRASHRAAARASGIVVKSPNLRDALPAHVDRRKVRIISNGIDLNRFQPLDRHECRQRLGWRDDRFHVMFSSNGGDACKRPELARAAAAALNADGVAAELHEMNGVSHQDVPIWLNASNALLITSITEGSPNVVKEALACNVPVVSVDVGDVVERTRGIEGCYIALPDAADLASKLKAVRDGTPTVAGRDRMQQLSLAAVAQRLSDFYRDIVGAPPQGVTTRTFLGGAGGFVCDRYS